jgi:H+/Cl- antiporter ClcA
MLSTSGDEKFGKLTLITAAATTIHMPIILGIIAGSLGALFINLGTRLTLLRKKYLKSDTSKIIEASIVLFLTVSSQCLMLTFLGKCKNISDESI